MRVGVGPEALSAREYGRLFQMFSLRCHPHTSMLLSNSYGRPHQWAGLNSEFTPPL